jgi:DNA-binding GntR family transcriptional regulator
MARSESRPEAIADRIRQGIMRGELAPGDRLSEYRLCQELSTGQPTVREALFVLQREGLVRRVANTGTFVTRLEAKDVKDLLEIRAQLEMFAADLAARNARPDDIAELHRHADGMALAAPDGSYERYLAADMAFHRKVWEMADNRYLIPMLDQVVVPLLACATRQWRRGPVEIEDSARRHHALADAVGQGPSVARRAMQRHVDEFFKTYLARTLRMGGGVK